MPSKAGARRVGGAVVPVRAGDLASEGVTPWRPGAMSGLGRSRFAASVGRQRAGGLLLDEPDVHHAITNHRIATNGDPATIRTHIRAEHWAPPEVVAGGPSCGLVVGFCGNVAVRTPEGWRAELGQADRDPPGERGAAGRFDGAGGGLTSALHPDRPLPGPGLRSTAQVPTAGHSAPTVGRVVDCVAGVGRRGTRCQTGDVRPLTVIRSASAVRVAVGAVLVVAPEMAAGARDSKIASARTRLVVRTLGIRDVIFGVGGLLSARGAAPETGTRRWIQLWLVNEVADIGAALLAAPELGAPAVAAAAVAPLPLIAADVWALRHLRVAP